MILHPAKQHTLATAAITTVYICLNMIELKEDDELGIYLRKIQDTLFLCRKDTLKKAYVSRKARNAIARMCGIYAEHIENKPLIKKICEDGRVYDLWAAMIVCAAGFCLDVKTTAPKYGARKHWRKLYALVNGLAACLVKNYPDTDCSDKKYPDIEKWGTMIYERAAWALEDVVFPIDEREMLLKPVACQI